MKKQLLVLLLVLLSGMATAPAYAWYGGWHGGGWRGGGWRGGYGWHPYWGGYGWGGGFYPGWGIGAFSAGLMTGAVVASPVVEVDNTPPVVVQQPEQPQTVVVQQPAAPAPTGTVMPPQQAVWYYCVSSKIYYPYTNSCPGGWKTVPATPPDVH